MNNVKNFNENEYEDRECVSRKSSKLMVCNLDIYWQ